MHLSFSLTRRLPSLDVENESAVQEALSRLLQGKTVLVIAHRMRTVAGADHIVVLENGHVAQQGTPEELMEQGGLYRRMVELQKETARWKLGRSSRSHRKKENGPYVKKISFHTSPFFMQFHKDVLLCPPYLSTILPVRSFSDW